MTKIDENYIIDVRRIVKFPRYDFLKSNIEKKGNTNQFIKQNSLLSLYWLTNSKGSNFGIKFFGKLKERDGFETNSVYFSFEDSEDGYNKAKSKYLELLQNDIMYMLKK